jgi:hypothetical protein
MRRNALKSVCLTMVLFFVLPVLAASAQTVTKTASQSQKKSQTVKVQVNDNAKVSVKDTVIVVTKVNNMTYSAGNAANKSDTIILSGNGKSEEKKFIVFNNDSKGHTGNDSVRVTCIVTTGDSMDNKAIHDLKWLGDGKRMIIMKDANGGNFDLPTPPPGAQVRVGYPLHDAFAFDPTDSDIVSYKKKDMGKGQEKITIIRKKKTKPAEIRNIEIKEEKLK